MPGEASFAGCSRLFSRYPLAVTPRSACGEYRSMVLMNRAAGAAGFFVLTQAPDDLFVIRSWCHDDRISQEIRPGEPVPDSVCQLIADAMPIPHDGTLLGWVSDRQVTALLTVHTGHPATRDAAVSLPEILVMPMSGAGELDWPPFTASPLSDGRLWDYVERSQIVDIFPLVARGAGHAFWVPCPHGRSPRRGTGCVVVTTDLLAEEYWLPAGVYIDHWGLREGIQAPLSAQLLELPGAVDLAGHIESHLSQLPTDIGS